MLYLKRRIVEGHNDRGTVINHINEVKKLRQMIWKWNKTVMNTGPVWWQCYEGCLGVWDGRINKHAQVYLAVVEMWYVRDVRCICYTTLERPAGLRDERPAWSAARWICTGCPLSLLQANLRSFIQRSFTKVNVRWRAGLVSPISRPPSYFTLAACVPHWLTLGAKYDRWCWPSSVSQDVF